jgi:tRNA pseudouridine synthase 9
MLSGDYYQQAVATGRLRVEASSSFPNLGGGTAGSRGGGRAAKGAGGRAAAAATGGGGGAWNPERPLRAGMCIRHFIHRHEPPVLAGEVQVRTGFCPVPAGAA